MAKKTKYGHLSREQIETKLEKLERKRYGLVWEDKEEDVAKQCETELPVLTEDITREIVGDTEKPYNFIIEGDNYHSLYTLNFTHKKKIDVIYIDPPYNTGKKDFKYNDHWVDFTDTYRHSKWLSFMNKRLRLAKSLLKDTGIIAISIDDNEMCNLKTLCDKIFNENNHIATVPTVMNLKGNQDQFGFAGTHEYTLFYAKNKSFANIGEFEISEEEFEKWGEDEYGLFKKGANLKATGVNAPREKRQNLFYPIYIDNNNEVYVTEDNAKLNKMDLEVYPITDNKEMSWRWEKNKIRKEAHNVIVVIENDNISLYKKQRPKLGDVPTKKPKSLFYKPEYSSGNGTALLKKIFNGNKVINNPKPIELIKDILFICGNKKASILDFFAGSGTTAHAVLELNKEDGGNRQFILCTNNENNICEEVTYPRVQKVIFGYADKEGIPANVKYFKQSFVPKATSDKDKRELVNRSTELLCMAENTFENVVKRSKRSDFAIFKNATKQTAIIYDEESIDTCISKLNEMQSGLKTFVYVFSYDHTYEVGDFEKLKIDFTVKPIPEAILNVYRKISKMRKK